MVLIFLLIRDEHTQLSITTSLLVLQNRAVVSLVFLSIFTNHITERLLRNLLLCISRPKNREELQMAYPWLPCPFLKPSVLQLGVPCELLSSVLWLSILSLCFLLTSFMVIQHLQTLLGSKPSKFKLLTRYISEAHVQLRYELFHFKYHNYLSMFGILQQLLFLQCRCSPGFLHVECSWVYWPCYDLQTLSGPSSKRAFQLVSWSLKTTKPENRSPCVY